MAVAGVGMVVVVVVVSCHGEALCMATVFGAATAKINPSEASPSVP
ncbi:hypothetical protein WDZ92_54165 [Nostoc sp. NIES-2111]